MHRQLSYNQKKVQLDSSHQVKSSNAFNSPTVEDSLAIESSYLHVVYSSARAKSPTVQPEPSQPVDSSARVKSPSRYFSLQ